MHECVRDPHSTEKNGYRKTSPIESGIMQGWNLEGCLLQICHTIPFNDPDSNEPRTRVPTIEKIKTIGSRNNHSLLLDPEDTMISLGTGASSQVEFMFEVKDMTARVTETQ